MADTMRPPPAAAMPLVDVAIDDRGDRSCPANAATRSWIKAADAQMYRLGYPYAAWVLRKGLFGIPSGYSLEFVREAPTRENAVELFGSRVLRVIRAI